MKIYWHSRGEDKAILASGIFAQSETLPVKPDRPWFCLLPFNKTEPSLFFAPREVQAYISPPKKTFKFESRIDAPNHSEWNKQIDQALHLIERKEFDKVVLGRKTTLRFAAPVDPFSLLGTAPNCTTFLFQPSPGIAFVGATPERLYRREGRKIFSEAVAGTRPRGKTPLEDAKLKHDLASCEKERREFAYVQQFLHAELSPLCEAIEWTPTDVLQTSAVQHLYSRLTGTLKEGITDSLLLETLHPTPALAGYPRKNALLHIQNTEPFSRGWYGAPLGWISPEKTEFAIGIRSALVVEKEVHLFAAVGIVKGSHPDREWEELDHKIAPWLEVFS